MKQPEWSPSTCTTMLLSISVPTIIRNKMQLFVLVASNKSEDDLNFTLADSTPQRTRKPFSTNRTAITSNDFVGGATSSSVM